VPFSDEVLEQLWEKTNGYCFYCGKRLSWVNYGVSGARGSWHVEHKNPVSRGGTDYMRNLVPACIDCNLEKSDRHARDFRQEWEPATTGGKIVEWLGLEPGTLGASRRRRRRE